MEPGQGRRLLPPGYVEGEEITVHWEGSYILWSLVIAALGAYVAFTTTMYMKQVSTTRWYWIMLVQAGLALGVCTVWCMHFVGMQAMVLCGGLQSGAQDKVPVTFEPVFTIVSALAAWLIATLALHIALGRTPAGRTRSMNEVEKQPSSSSRTWHLKQLLRTTPVKRICGAAMLVALGVCVMHYMGMLSQTGCFSMEYNIGIIFASAVVAAIASLAGLAIFFVLFDSITYRMLAAVVVSLAVNGMHYTGMQSAKYYVAPYHGIWGESTVAWNLEALSVLIGVLVLNFLLMACTGYYVEVLETVRKREGEAFEKELRHKSYTKSARELIQRSKVMRYPMCLLRYETFVRLGKLVPHEALRDSNRLIYINSAHAAHKEREKKKRFIVFFSHQWLSSNMPDPKNRHYQDMIAALVGLSKVYRVKLENMIIWVDYSSIPQEGLDQQQLAIDSIVSYVSVCSAFVIVAPQVLHTETQTPCNFMTYAKRCWCRLEVFCSLISSLRNKAPGASSAIPEGDEKEECTQGNGMPQSPEEAVGIASLPPPPPPHPVPQAGETGSLLQDMHRVFLVVDDQLHRLNFFTRDGHLRNEYQELLYVFEGELECCRLGHVGSDGRQLVCDKTRLVDSICGCYGSMLLDLRRSRRRRARHEEVDESRRILAEHINGLRHEIFPHSYFDTRIDAIQSQVENSGGRAFVHKASIDKMDCSPTGGEQTELDPLSDSHSNSGSASDSSDTTSSVVVSDQDIADVLSKCGHDDDLNSI